MKTIKWLVCFMQSINSPLMINGRGSFRSETSSMLPSRCAFLRTGGYPDRGFLFRPLSSVEACGRLYFGEGSELALSKCLKNISHQTQKTFSVQIQVFLSRAECSISIMHGCLRNPDKVSVFCLLGPQVSCEFSASEVLEWQPWRLKSSFPNTGTTWTGDQFPLCCPAEHSLCFEIRRKPSMGQWGELRASVARVDVFMLPNFSHG